MIYISSRCVYWFLRLVLDQSMCRRMFGSSTVIFIFICINPFIASYKCFHLSALNSVTQTCLLAIQISAPWSVGPVGTIWLILRHVGCLKVGKLD
jgi:hypothetical protein